jgi:hypothetical protein
MPLENSDHFSGTFIKEAAIFQRLWPLGGSLVGTQPWKFPGSNYDVFEFVCIIRGEFEVASEGG